MDHGFSKTLEKGGKYTRVGLGASLFKKARPIVLAGRVVSNFPYWSTCNFCASPLRAIGVILNKV